MSEGLERAARRASAGCESISDEARWLGWLLDSVVSAAAARVMTTVSHPAVDLCVRRVVFTMDSATWGPGEPVCARAYPVADSAAANLDLAVQGASTVGVGVDLIDACGLVIEGASVEYAVSVS
jgi:hypothetical protein